MAYIDYIIPKESMSGKILGTANDMKAKEVSSDRSARIAELEAELADIRKRRQNLDIEGEMGRYKFQFDADPSTYMNYKQNKRNAAQTEAIRKATEEATKASNAQTAWRQLLIDEETEKYKKIDAEDRAKKALAAGDMDAYTEAMKQAKRSEATLARYDRDKNQYRSKFGKLLGLDTGDEVVADYDAENDPNVVNLKKFNEIASGIDKELVNLRQRVTSMTDRDKKAIIENANNVLAEYRNTDVSFLNDAQKAAWEKKLAEFEDAIPTFKKNQGTTMTQKKFAKLGIKELKARGLAQLKKDRNAGLTNDYLDKVINILSSSK